MCCIKVRTEPTKIELSAELRLSLTHALNVVVVDVVKGKAILISQEYFDTHRHQTPHQPAAALKAFAAAQLLTLLFVCLLMWWW